MPTVQRASEILREHFIAGSLELCRSCSWEPSASSIAQVQYPAAAYLLSCPCNPQFPLAEPVPDWEERISKLSRACAQTCGESHSPGIAPPGSRTAKFRLRSMIPGSRTVARRYQSAMNLGESSGKPGTPPVTVHQTLWLGKDWAGVRSMAITVTVVLAILALGSALSSRRPDARQ